MASHTAPPETLAAALERINHLEEQLALAHRLFHQHSVGNENLSDYLAAATARSGTSPSPPYRSVSQRSSSSSLSPSSRSDAGSDRAPTSATDPAALAPAHKTSKSTKPVPVDIGAFVLRALALRKNLTIGIVDPVEAEAEFARIVDGSGLNDKQTSQVREWAGLA
ncbi:hypothetical protein JCM11491_002274 [Sporobolomyces phaffii]